MSLNIPVVVLVMGVLLHLAGIGAFQMNSLRTSTLPSRTLHMRDYPKPDRLENTENFKEAGRLSARFKELKRDGVSKNVAIIGGGLSGLAAARYLVDAGHKPVVFEVKTPDMRSP